MPKKAVASLPETKKGQRKGEESPTSLKARAESLRALAMKADAISKSAKDIEMESIAFDGATRFDRGVELIDAFLQKCHAEVSREKFARGIV